MHEIEFINDTPTANLAVFPVLKESSTLAALLKKAKIVKTDRQATIVLIALIAVCIIITSVIGYYFVFPHTAKTVIINPDLTTQFPRL